MNQSAANATTITLLVLMMMVIIIAILLFRWFPRFPRQQQPIVVQGNPNQNVPAAPADGTGQPAQNNPPAADTAGGSNWGWNLLLGAVALVIVTVTVVGVPVFLNWWFPTLFSNINIPWPTYGIAFIIAVLILAAFIDKKTGKGAGK